MPFKKGTKLIVLDEITRKFLAVLRNERQRKGLTLKETAVYIGCTFSKISAFERGESYPGLLAIYRAVHVESGLSLECLDAVLGVLKRENELYHFRKGLLSGRK